MLKDRPPPKADEEVEILMRPRDVADIIQKVKWRLALSGMDVGEALARQSRDEGGTVGLAEFARALREPPLSLNELRDVHVEALWCMVGGGLAPPAVSSGSREETDESGGGKDQAEGPSPSSEAGLERAHSDLFSVQGPIVGSRREPSPSDWDASTSRLEVSIVAEAFLDEEGEDARVCLRVLQVCTLFGAIYGCFYRH
jgi:hypothetical protein